MRHQFKKMCSLLLVLAVLGSIFLMPIHGQDDVIDLLALGDSIATGYRLDNYDSSDLSKAKDAYVNLLGVGMGIEPVNLAKDKLAGDGLLVMLDDDDVLESVGNAKIICISIGGNNVLQPLLSTIKLEFGLKETDTNEALGAQIQKVGLLTALPKLKKGIEAAQPVIEEGITAFEEEFPQIIEKIRSQAPDARVLVSNLYNPYVGVKFGDMNLEVVVEAAISEINGIITSTLEQEKYQGTYEVVDIKKAFGTKPAESGYVNVSLVDSNVDPHPSKKGNEAIFDAYAKLLIPGFVSFSFTDIDGHLGEDSIRYMAGIGVISGKGNGIFDPNGNVKRSEFVKILSGAVMGKDVQSLEDRTFIDLVAGQWYLPYVKWAVKNGVTTGDTKGAFRPDDRITRQDLVVMVYRYVKMSDYVIEIPSEQGTFADDAKIADYAREAVYALSAAGFIPEEIGENFRPTDFATRAEATMILARYARSLR